jgi:hypothetical protein
LKPARRQKETTAMGKTDDPNRWKGFVLGVVGGAVGVLAMGYYWQAVTALTGQDPRKEKNEDGPHALDDIAVAGQHHQEGESSTAAMARILDEAATGKEPKKETKMTLSTLIHWGYGMLVGGLYGAMRGGAADVPDVPGGLGYGTGLWLFGSELAVPMLGLAEGPTTQPLESHAYALGAHFVYGTVAAATTQILYRVL